jgi:hypothetical protein
MGGGSEPRASGGELIGTAHERSRAVMGPANDFIEPARSNAASKPASIDDD